MAKPKPKAFLYRFGASNQVYQFQQAFSALSVTELFSYGQVVKDLKRRVASGKDKEADRFLSELVQLSLEAK